MSSPRIHAPDLTPAGDWFNVPAPLTLAALRGKVVLLDFWTYGCINCMHILPGLRRLEEKYRDELVVIGVHSAKFANERKSENIRRILVRYDIDHPVVSDADFTIWRAYGARAWPTLVLIDPEGYVVATASGEGHLEQLDRAIAAVIQVFDERQLLDRRPIAQSPERERLKTSALAFPGKVLADETGSRLFIADSNHHRVLVASMTGTILDVAGSGAAGWVDGGFDNATFYRPQGLALEGDMLYVADTENHVVRSLDLKARRVTTVAGTGRMGAWPDYALRASSRSRLNDLSARPNGRSMRETPLNSPWDLVVREQLLFVAMAGTHQIWLVDLEKRLASPYAGSGREARIDGPVDEAAFAQPSGLAIAESTLFVADSESNIIRSIELPPANRVRTIAGGDLFDFGDRDGNGDAVRLQHPLGLTRAGGVLFIADTYNHKIKTLNPVTGDVRTFAGSGVEGHEDGAAAVATFYEPGGLSATSDALFVADTNNHAIRRVRLTDGRVETLELSTSSK
ncbi:MAG TPA: thioredoxin-like domain-containing protein [Vicinamibacterales bacterium]